MQIMHALHKLTLSTSKMAEGVKEDVHFRRWGGGEGSAHKKEKEKKKMCTGAKELRFILSGYSFRGKESSPT